jgi:hypothetical protein
MPPVTTKILPSIGPVTFRKSARARRLSITIKSDQAIKVTIPRGISQATAQDFLLSRAGWVKKHLSKIKKLQQGNSPVNLKPIEREKAKAILTERLSYLAGEYGFRYNRVFIKNQKTIWGSCSGKNNINLNMNLIRLPVELRDYVLLHELVHTRIKNHSKKFWAELDKYVGGRAKELRKEMRGYRLRVG